MKAERKEGRKEGRRKEGEKGKKKGMVEGRKEVKNKVRGRPLEDEEIKSWGLSWMGRAENSFSSSNHFIHERTP